MIPILKRIQEEARGNKVARNSLQRIQGDLGNSRFTRDSLQNLQMFLVVTSGARDSLQRIQGGVGISRDTVQEEVLGCLALIWTEGITIDENNF